MTHTVTLLAGNKGFTTPSVVGDEYVVDANVDITSYTAGGEVLSASSFGLSRINAVVVTGASIVTIAAGYQVSGVWPETDADGDYASSSTFQLVVSGASNTDPVRDIRLRIWGQIA